MGFDLTQASLTVNSSNLILCQIFPLYGSYIVYNRLSSRLSKLIMSIIIIMSITSIHQTENIEQYYVMT